MQTTPAEQEAPPGARGSEATTASIARGSEATTFSWRERRRSRVAEIVDGGAMLFSDVAMIRTLAVVAVMWGVAFAARRCSNAAFALAITAGLYLIAETINTLVEMLVDRISLEANVFSARIKHAGAFLSAAVGTVAFLLLALVGYHLFFRPTRDTRNPQSTAASHIVAPTVAPAAPPAVLVPAAPTVAPAPAPTMAPAAIPAALATAPASPGPCSAPRSAPQEPLPHGSETSGTHEQETTKRYTAAAGAAAALRWIRNEDRQQGGTRQRAPPFASRHVLHPFDWERRVARKRRLRRRKAAAEGRITASEGDSAGSR